MVFVLSLSASAECSQAYVNVVAMNFLIATHHSLCRV